MQSSRDLAHGFSFPLNCAGKSLIQFPLRNTLLVINCDRLNKTHKKLYITVHYKSIIISPYAGLYIPNITMGTMSGLVQLQMHILPDFPPIQNPCCIQLRYICEI